MKLIKFLFVVVAVVVVLTPGCSNPSPQEGGFTVLTEYGAPGAYTPDSGVAVSGSTIPPDVCSPSTDGNCYLTFSGVTNSSGIYNVATDAVGGQIWDISGSSSANCQDGYPAVSPTVGDTQEVPLVCADQTAYFKASPGSWTSGKGGSTVTYTANHSVFPTSSYSTLSTLYDDDGNQQWQGSEGSSSQSVITEPVEDGAVGRHIVVFRNPSTHAVLGAGAYVVGPAQVTCPPSCHTHSCCIG